MKIGFLGLGLMGAGMAGQLLAKGYDLAVWNRNPARLAPFGTGMARIAESPADAARGADIVFAMLADDAASRAVWLGSDGALAAMARGAVAVECSTLTVDWVRELAEAAAGRGLGFADAPVTGSRAQAEAGQLRFLAGGGAGTIDRVRPALLAMGSDVVDMGPTGSGALVKLINNFLCGVQGAALAEALVMAERGGLDIGQAVAVLNGGAPGSPFQIMLSQRMLARDYRPNFTARMMAKDLGYAVAQFIAKGIDPTTGVTARARFLAAVEADPDGDIALVVEPVRRQT